MIFYRSNDRIILGVIGSLEYKSPLLVNLMRIISVSLLAFLPQIVIPIYIILSILSKNRNKYDKNSNDCKKEISKNVVFGLFVFGILGILTGSFLIDLCYLITRDKTNAIFMIMVSIPPILLGTTLGIPIVKKIRESRYSYND